MASRVTEIIVTVIVFGALLTIGLPILNNMAATAGELGGAIDDADEEPAALSGTNWVTLDDGTGTNETVQNTTGYELALYGENDSDFAFDKGLETDSSDNYTVCTWAEINSTASPANRTLVTAGGDVTISYRNATGGDQWHVFIYDPETRTSTEYTAPANNEENRGQVCAWRDGSDVRLYRNATRIANATFDESGSANANLTTANWHGTVEETRFFDDPLNSTERNDTYTQPTAPLTAANRTDRIYYDAGRGDAVYAFISPDEPQAATIGGNYSWQQTGFDGAEMVAGTDYEWDTDGPRIKALAGGDLENQPGAWVSYDGGEAGAVTAFTQQFEQSMTVFPLVLPVLGLVLVIGVLRQL